MNYRHAYHAGNFADCFKHALLISLMDSFARKPAPYFVLDTHAGAGWYDLDAAAARRTAEADSGIFRLLRSAPSELARYLGLVAQVGLYPGSPALIRAILRPQDRLACCELHPEEATTLRHRFRNDEQVEVHRRSGWEALGALLPPKEQRGLVFIDPPFEAADEFQTLLHGLRRGHDRFRHGVFAAWYPIKQLAVVREFRATLATSGMRDIIAVELSLRDTATADRFSGCGLAVINPPYRFADQALPIADAVVRGLDANDAGAGASVIRLCDE
jgi:23S rRNA (adenine2030-N6)-methyltransferase